MQDTQPSRQGSFLGSVNIVLLTYAADGLLAFATAALVARALEPAGRGAYGLFILSAAFGQLVLGLGIGNAAIYYVNRGEIALRDVVAAVHVAALWSLAVTAAAVAALAPWAGDEIFGERISPWLLVAAVPVLLYANLLRLVLQALSRFLDLGVATVGQQLVLLGLVAVAYATGDPSPGTIVVFFIAASLAAAAYELLRIGVANVDLAQVLRPSTAVLRRLIGFGAQGEAGNVLQLANYRLDQYIVRGFVGLGGVGVYAVGASVSEAMFIVANAVALVLMPRLTSADPDDVAWMAPVASRNTMLLAGAGAVVLAVAAPLFIPAVFGDAYRDAVQALWLLLPGAVALTGAKVLTSYIFSQGRPLVNTGITVASLAVTLAADLALVPAFGVNGAATASSLAYVAHLCAALYAYRRLSGRPASEALIPRASDAHLYVDAARGVLQKLARRPALEPGGPA